MRFYLRLDKEHLLGGREHLFRLRDDDLRPEYHGLCDGKDRFRSRHDLLRCRNDHLRRQDPRLGEIDHLVLRFDHLLRLRNDYFVDGNDHLRRKDDGRRRPINE